MKLCCCGLLSSPTTAAGKEPNFDSCGPAAGANVSERRGRLLDSNAADPKAPHQPAPLTSCNNALDTVVCNGSDPSQEENPVASTSQLQHPAQPAALDVPAPIRTARAQKPTNAGAAGSATSQKTLPQPDPQLEIEALEVLASESAGPSARSTPAAASVRPSGRGSQPVSRMHASSGVGHAMVSSPTAGSSQDRNSSSTGAALSVARGAAALRLHNEHAPPSETNINLCSPEELVADVSNLSYLGHGSFAAVFQGCWQGTRVAVKFVASDSMSSGSVALRETLLSAMLSHPNVIHTYTTRCAMMTDSFLRAAYTSAALQRGPAHLPSVQQPWDFSSGDGFGDPRFLSSLPCITVGDILYRLQIKPGQYVVLIVMEYADKGTLQAALHKRQVFKPNEQWNQRVMTRALLRTAREVALGMAHLHAHNVVHGDLKPANVLLTSSRLDRRAFIAKLTDFGLSQIAAGPTPIGSWATFTYMAPEHFDGIVSPATDVYSFGMVLWEMVTMKRPYEGMSAADIMAGVKAGLRPTWPPDGLPELKRLGQECLLLDASRRPTFPQVVEALEQIELLLRDSARAERQQQAAAAAANTAAAPPLQPGGSSPGCGPLVGGTDQAQAQPSTAAAVAEPEASSISSHPPDGDPGLVQGPVAPSIPAAASAAGAGPGA